MDNSVIKAEIGQARIKHMLFKTKLRSYLYGSNTDTAPIVNAGECSFGQWLQQFPSKYGSSYELHEVNYLHEEIHDVAKRLVAMYDKGKAVEARASLAEIEAVSDKLIEALDRLELKYSK